MPHTAPRSSCHAARSIARSFLLALAVLGAGTGCRQTQPAALLDIEAVEPLGDPGAGTFLLRGRGFPTDRPAAVELHGVVHRPGREASAVDVSLAGAAVSAERLEFVLDGQPELTALSPGQFEGDIAVAFEAGATQVRGQLAGARLTLRSGQTRARRDTLRAARRGSEWLASLGATDLEVDPDRPGVRVGRVEAAGVAELSGLAPGDRIVALDDSPVSDLVDLWPPPGAAPVRLRVERGAASTQSEVSLPRAHGQRLRAEPRPGVVAALVLSLLGLLWLWPPRTRAVGAGARTSAAALVAGVIVLFGVGVQVGAGGFHAVRGLLPAVLAYGVLAPLLGPRPGRLEAFVRAGSQLSVVCLAVATAGLLSGTLSAPLTASAVADDWPLLLQPPGWCLLGLTHLTLRTPSDDVVQRGLAAGARGVTTCGLVALLGGAGLWPGPGPVVGLSVVCLGVWLSLEWIHDRHPVPPTWLGAAVVGGPVVAVAWFLGAPAQQTVATAAALSPWLLAALGLRVAVARARGRYWPTPVIDPQLAPFL